MVSGGGGMFSPRRSEDIEPVTDERRRRMGGNYQMNPWERRALAGVGVVVAIGVLVAVVLFVVI